jgi:5-methyltetrahydrofolate--homocysteine methyltransferase
MAFPDDWARIRERYEAFWRGEALDRPLLRVTTPRPDGPPAVPEDRCPDDPEVAFHWFTDPDRVLPRLGRQLERALFFGDAFPLVFPVSTSLVAIQAAYLGGRYGLRSGTGWCEPVLDDWASRPPLAVDPSNPWWAATQRLLDEGVRAFAGRAAVGIPDLQGGGQILDLLRGTERLAIDLVENGNPVHLALQEIDTAWLAYWQRCNDLILLRQDGYVDWLGVWSGLPAVTIECDFSCMISPRLFEEFFLPSLRRQTAWVERTIYHLDGPGAVRHLDALLDLETLDGIQWVPGTGARPMIEWLPLLRRIQEGGKRLVIACQAGETLGLLDALRPDGLLISTRCRSGEEAQALVAEAARRSGR